MAHGGHLNSFPRYIIATRSLIWRTTDEVVGDDDVREATRCPRSSSRLMIWAWILSALRADTGSSATISLGRNARVRAIPMRWRWPPGELVRVAVVVLGAEPNQFEQFLDRRFGVLFGPDLLQVATARPLCHRRCDVG